MINTHKKYTPGLRQSAGHRMNPTIITSFLFYILLSLVSILISGAPVRVHIANIVCFFIAFFLSTVAAEKRLIELPVYIIWLVVGLVGLFVWDVASSLVIFKAEVFMGWYIIYPIGLLGILCLQILACAIGEHGPFKKRQVQGSIKNATRFQK